MSAFRCYSDMCRIVKMPSSEWKAAVAALPTDCGHADCTTRNCQKEVRDRLLMIWKIQKSLRGKAA